MRRFATIAAMMLAAITVATVQPVHAGPINDAMRWLGWGWSDGYHSGHQPMRRTGKYYGASQLMEPIQPGYSAASFSDSSERLLPAQESILARPNNETPTPRSMPSRRFTMPASTPR